MAKTDADNVEFVSEDEWETVAPESGEPIKFDNKGDTFVGTYLGTSVIDFTETEDGKPVAKSFNQHRFAEPSGEIRTLNGGYKFDNELVKIPTGSKVRITFMGLVDVNQPSPMRDYRIEVAGGVKPPTA